MPDATIRLSISTPAIVAHRASILSKSSVPTGMQRTSHPLPSFVGDWAGFNTLRNTIAHTRWTTGQRPINQAAEFVDQKGRAKFVGDGADELDYTAADLEAAPARFHEVNERLELILTVSGLNRVIESRMADEIADNL